MFAISLGVRLLCALLLAQAVIKFLLKKAALAGRGAEMEAAIGEASVVFAICAVFTDHNQ